MSTGTASEPALFISANTSRFKPRSLFTIVRRVIWRASCAAALSITFQYLTHHRPEIRDRISDSPLLNSERLWFKMVLRTSNSFSFRLRRELKAVYVNIVLELIQNYLSWKLMRLRMNWILNVAYGGVSREFGAVHRQICTRMFHLFRAFPAVRIQQLCSHTRTGTELTVTERTNQYTRYSSGTLVPHDII